MWIELFVIVLAIVIAILVAVLTSIIGEMRALREHVRIMTAHADRVLHESPDIRSRVTSLERHYSALSRVLRELEKRRNKYRPDRRNAEHML